MILLLALRLALAGDAPRVFVALDDVIPTASGPALLVEGGLLRPNGRYEPTGLDRAVLGDELLTLDDNGLRWLDAEGHLLGSLPPGSVSELREVDRVPGGLVFPHDGIRLGAPSAVDAETGGVGGGDDHPDLPDRGELTPPHDPVVHGTSGGRLVLVQRLEGVEVQGQGGAWGQVLPLRPRIAGISPDGRALVVMDADGLSAWSVATGERLWVREVDRDAQKIRVGADFIGVQHREAWTFFDPREGRTLGSISVQRGVARSDGEALGPLGEVTGAALRGEPWALPAPERQAREVSEEQNRSTACDLSTLELSPLSRPPPAASEAEREGPWPWMVDADLVWSVSRPILAAVAGPDGMVIVAGRGFTAALDRRGVLRWRRDELLLPRALSGGLLITGQGGLIAALDPRTGERRWRLDLAVVGWLAPEGGWVLPVRGGAWRWLDPRTGRLLERAPDGSREPHFSDDPDTPSREDLLAAAKGLPVPDQVAIGSGRTLVKTRTGGRLNGPRWRWELKSASGETLQRWEEAAGVVGSGGVVWAWSGGHIAAWYSGPPSTTPAR